jgi:hypothetical protein
MMARSVLLILVPTEQALNHRNQIFEQNKQA